MRASNADIAAPRRASPDVAPSIPAAATKPVLGVAPTLRKAVGWGLRADRWLGTLNSAGSLVTLVAVAATVQPFAIGFAAAAAMWIGLSLAGSAIQWWRRRQAEKAYPTEVAMARAAASALPELATANPAWATDPQVQESLAVARFFARSPGRMVLNNFTAPVRMAACGVHAMIGSFRKAPRDLGASENVPDLPPQAPRLAQTNTPLAQTPPPASTTPPVPPRSALRPRTADADPDAGFFYKMFRNEHQLLHPRPFRGARHASLDANAAEEFTLPPQAAVDVAPETPTLPQQTGRWKSVQTRVPTPGPSLGRKHSPRARKNAAVTAVAPKPSASRQGITPSVEPPRVPNPTPVVPPPRTP